MILQLPRRNGRDIECYVGAELADDSPNRKIIAKHRHREQKKRSQDKGV